MLFPFFLRSPLFNEAPADGAQGGGSGDGTGQEGQAAGDGGANAGEGQQPQTGLTIDALKEILKAERESTLKAVTSQINGLDAKLKKQFEAKEKPKESSAMTPEQMLAEKEREFQTQIDQLRQERATEKKQMQRDKLAAEIKSSLADFAWQTDSKGKSVGREIAQDFYIKQTEFDDDGAPTISGMPVASYIREHAASAFKPYHSQRPIGGAGAGSGSGKLSPTFSIQDLQRKAQSGEALTADEKKAAREELARYASGRS